MGPGLQVNGVGDGALDVVGSVVFVLGSVAVYVSPLPPPHELTSKAVATVLAKRRALLVTCEHVFIQVLSWFIVLQTANCLHFHLPPIHSNE